MLAINKILWGIATIMLLGSGLYFTYKLKFVQFRFKSMFLSLKSDDTSGITPFQSLNIALAARIGVGSLAGIALAIHYGGLGTIFWMLISAIICSSNAFAESVLGVMYKVRDENNIYRGGPAYYIKKGLNKNKLSKLYAIIIILAYIVGFSTIQANTIIKSITNLYNINAIIIALIIVILIMFIIINGVKSIALVTSKLVPFMAVGYFILSSIIIISNARYLPSIFLDIFRDAFNLKAGLGILVPLIIGVQRGVFSHEAGIGTGAIAAATSNTNNALGQGFNQTLGIYIDGVIICILTSLVIATSNYETLSLSNLNGIEITQYAFNYHLGNIGNYAVMITIILFAFSTIITGYYYGESSLKFLFHKINKLGILLFKLFTLIVLFIGAIISPTIIWNIADTLIVILAIINVWSVFKLRNKVTDEYKRNK